MQLEEHRAGASQLLYETLEPTFELSQGDPQALLRRAAAHNRMNEQPGEHRLKWLRVRQHIDVPTLRSE